MFIAARPMSPTLFPIKNPSTIAYTPDKAKARTDL